MALPSNAAEESLSSLLEGQPQAVDQLFAILHAELHQRADALLAREAPGRSLVPTELVNEAWLKFVHLDRLRLNGRQHFLAIASLAMKQVLIDRARARNAQKRAAGARVELASDMPGGESIPVDMLDLGDALRELDERFPKQAQIAAMHLSGMTLQEVAEHQGRSFDSVRDQWRFARMFLNRKLGGALA